MAFPVESAGAFRVAFRGRSELVSPSDRIPRRRSKSLLRGSCDAVLRIVYGILPRSYPNASGTLRSALSSTTSPFTGSSTMHCNVLDSPCFQIGRDSRDHTFSAEAAPERIFRPTPFPPRPLTTSSHTRPHTHPPHPLPTLLPDARPKRASVGILTSGREASPRPAKYPSRESEFPFTFRSMERGSMSSESKQGFQRNPILSTNKSSESPDEAYEFQQIRQLISTLYPLPNRHKKESDSKSFCEFGSPPLVFPIV